VVLGIPTEALLGGGAAIAALVVALKFLAGKKGAGQPKKSTTSGGGGHTDLKDLMSNPGAPALPSAEEVEEEEEAGKSVDTSSLEALLARPIDEAPSIGSDEKTNVEAGLADIKFEKTPQEKPFVPAEIKEPPKEEKVEVPVAAPVAAPSLRGKNLIELHERDKEEVDLDSLEEEQEPVEGYVPPQDIKARAEKETSTERPVRLYDRPAPERKENYNRFCMNQYDAGQPPKKVENLLRVKGMGPTTAKQTAFRTYKIWVEKREPLIREIKASREMIKRVEYKYFKQQIDETTRKNSLNDTNTRIAELESRLKASEDYFI